MVLPRTEAPGQEGSGPDGPDPAPAPARKLGITVVDVQTTAAGPSEAPVGWVRPRHRHEGHGQGHGPADHVTLELTTFTKENTRGQCRCPLGVAATTEAPASAATPGLRDSGTPVTPFRRTAVPRAAARSSARFPWRPHRAPSVPQPCFPGVPATIPGVPGVPGGTGSGPGGGPAGPESESRSPRRRERPNFNQILMTRPRK